MTVKCINELQKEVMAAAFFNKLLTVEDLMQTSGKSRRTVMRVLEEAGVAPPVRKRKAKVSVVQQNLDQPIYFPTRPGWIARLTRAVSQSFSFLR